MLDERREPFSECLCVLLAEIDLVLRAAYREQQHLVGGTPVKIIFECDLDPCCHPGPP